MSETEGFCPGCGGDGFSTTEIEWCDACSHWVVGETNEA